MEKQPALDKLDLLAIEGFFMWSSPENIWASDVAEEGNVSISANAKC